MRLFLGMLSHETNTFSNVPTDRAQFEAEQADIRPIRKHFYRRMGPTGFKKEEVEASLEQLAHTCARMDKALEDGPWLLGTQYTLADIIAAPLIDRMADLGLFAIWEAKHPRVAAWYARMRARPRARGNGPVHPH